MTLPTHIITRDELLRDIACELALKEFVLIEKIEGFVSEHIHYRRTSDDTDIRIHIPYLPHFTPQERDEHMAAIRSIQ